MCDRIAVMNARPGRAGRRADRDLRAPAHALRRRLHRRDQHPGGGRPARALRPGEDPPGAGRRGASRRRRRDRQLPGRRDALSRAGRRRPHPAGARDPRRRTRARAVRVTRSALDSYVERSGPVPVPGGRLSLRTLGIITIGQAPRDDIADLFAPHAPAGTKVVLRGALDGLSDAEVDAAEAGERRRHALLASARRPRRQDLQEGRDRPLAAAFAKLRADGCDAIVYACTGDFPPMEGDEGVLFPSRVLNGLARGLLPRGRLGLLIPLAEQAEKLASKWARPGLEVFAEALAPSADARRGRGGRASAGGEEARSRGDGLHELHAHSPRNRSSPRSACRRCSPSPRPAACCARCSNDRRPSAASWAAGRRA